MMVSAVLWWLCLNVLLLMMLAFYSMMEMACVSFNKLRLQYYVTQGQQRAIWLNKLLQNPSAFFGTTLIGVNIALMAGSECARQLYAAMHLSPDLAPLTQVLIVVIFGELAPMFAARRYAEHVALLGIPLLYGTARLLAPALWILKYIIKFCNWLIGGKEAVTSLYLTQEELINMLEQRDDERLSGGEGSDFNKVVSQIFSLRNKTAEQLMSPLDAVHLYPSHTTVGHIRHVLQKKQQSYFAIYHREKNNIVAIATARDLIRASQDDRVRDYARQPWFVTQKTGVLQILQQFKKNNYNVAVILNTSGQAIGLLALDDIVEEILGTMEQRQLIEADKAAPLVIIDKTVPGDMTIAEFKAEFNTIVPGEDDQTISNVIIEKLGHVPSVGELIFVMPYEWIVKEVTLLGVKTVNVRTRSHL